MPIVDDAELAHAAMPFFPHAVPARLVTILVSRDVFRQGVKRKVRGRVRDVQKERPVRVLPLMSADAVGRVIVVGVSCVIMADDMGYSDIGSYGSEISTPNLDRLAEGGLRFRQFYNNAKCSPTRASLLTGLYPHEAGMGDLANGAPGEPGPYQGYLPENSVAIAEVLRAAGYRTYMSGKWHIGDLPEHWPHSRGFDRYFGLISGATSFFELLPEPGRTRQMVMEDRLWQPAGDGFYAMMLGCSADPAPDCCAQPADTAAAVRIPSTMAVADPHDRRSTGFDILTSSRFPHSAELQLRTLAARPSLPRCKPSAAAGVSVLARRPSFSQRYNAPVSAQRCVTFRTWHASRRL